MRVRDLLRRKGATVVTIEAERDVAEAARLLMRHDIGGLPVVTRSGELLGFLAERDIVRALDGTSGDVRDVPVRRAMRRPAPSCAAEDSLQELMARMTRDRLRHVVVLDGGRIAGVISVGDLVKNRLEELETEAGVLRDQVAARRALI